jgi:YVTN family beta-propeller protein
MSPRSGLLLTCALALAAAAACSENSGPAAGPPVGIVITPGDTAFQEGRGVQYHAALVDSAGTTVSGGSFTWSTNEPTLATVSASGLVTGHSVGTVLVTATRDTFSSSVSLTVIDSLITTRLPIYGGPFGLAVFGPKAYVTLPYPDSLAVVNVPGEALSSLSPAGGTPTGVAFNAAGTKAVVSNQGGATLGIVTVATNAMASTVPIPGSPFVVCTSASGDTAWVTVGDRNRVYAVNMTSLTLVDSSTTPDGPNGLARHSTLPRLYVSGMLDGKVYELDATTLDSLRSWSLGGAAQGVVVSADGTKLFVANEWGWIDVITLASGAVGTPVVLPGGQFGLALSPDGTRLAVSDTHGTVHVLNASTLATIRTVTTGGTPRRLAYRPDGTRLLVANEAGWVDFIR